MEILIFENETETRLALKEAFERDGFRCSTHSTNEFRADRIQDPADPKVVLLGFDFDDATAADVLALWKESNRFRSVPLILCSSDIVAHLPHGVVQVGRHLPLQKLVGLVERISSALGSSRGDGLGIAKL